MKNTILIIAVTIVTAVTVSSACGQPDKRIQEARENLAEAKIDSAADFQKFKQEAERKLNETQVKIAALKAKKQKERKDVTNQYDTKISELEKKNEELRKRIEGSSSTKTNKWTSFKRTFNHDMDELGKTLKKYYN